MCNIFIYDINPILSNAIYATVKKSVKGATISIFEKKFTIQVNKTNEQIDLLILGTWINHEGPLLEILKSVGKSTRVFLYYEDFSMALHLKKYFMNIVGLTSKQVEEEIFIKNIEGVLNGKQVLCHLSQEALMTEISFKRDSQKAMERKLTSEKLTSRETQIMNLVILGTKTSAIAKELNLQMSTVSTIKSSIFRKLNVNNSIDLVNKVQAPLVE